jgi:HSP20 family molecular chaperone IbpA
MTRVATFPSPLFLGFEDLERALEQVTRRGGNDGFPPYNIERLAPNGAGNPTIRISLAVAGFSSDDLEIVEEDKKLVIRGKQQDESERDYLHRGIAARQFQRSFVLSDGIEVSGARLENGLLLIDLQRIAPERTSRRIEISSL